MKFMCPIEPRRLKRAPWAAQSKEERRKIISAHSGQIFPKSTLLALEMRAKGVENLPKERKIEMIKENMPAIAREIARVEKLEPRDVQRRMAHRLPEMDEKTINGAAQIWMIKKIEDEKRDFSDRLKKTVKSYFKARKIPLVDRDFISALNYYMRDKNFDQLARGIDLKEIEKTYIEFRKTSRWYKINDAEITNSYMGRITKGESFTPNQKKAIKRWLKKELLQHSGMRRAIFAMHIGNFAEAVRKAKELDKAFIESAREKFSKDFQQTLKKRETQTKNQIQAPSKIGTREERLATYTPRKKEDGSQTRATELKRSAEYSRQAGRPFNTSEYCLTEISKENEQAGTSIRKLYTNGMVNTGTLVGLFTSGSLTQRIFLNVVEKTDFIRRFGQSQINALAKGLSFIGPQGKIITRAKRALQSPRREEIFSFLDRNGFLETGHGGGNVVYLKRI